MKDAAPCPNFDPKPLSSVRKACGTCLYCYQQNQLEHKEGNLMMLIVLECILINTGKYINLKAMFIQPSATHVQVTTFKESLEFVMLPSQKHANAR